MGAFQGFAAPDEGQQIAQHWRGNWRPAEGTWAWAASIGLRAVAIESLDHFEGPPTRPGLRAQFYRRDEQLHGTGELVSWTRGQELSDLGVEEVLAGIEAQYQTFMNGAVEDAAIEVAICDLFMALRCSDRMDLLLVELLKGAEPGWLGCVRRALQFELLTKSQQALLSRNQFWGTGVMPEFLSLLPVGEWSADQVRWSGFKQDLGLRFGQLVLWSSGICGQVFREAVLVDLTDLVLEQGLIATVVGKDALHRNRRSFARWAVLPLLWRAERFKGKVSSQWAIASHLQSALAGRQGMWDEIGWQVEARHWARIVEWVLVWRREISSPQMLDRAKSFAALLLLEDSPGGVGTECCPYAEMAPFHETPKSAADIDTRLGWKLEIKYPADFRLVDELYPAIAAGVLAWLRGAGLAGSSREALAKASWLGELIPEGRPRMANALAAIQTFVRGDLQQMEVAGLDENGLEAAVCAALQLKPAQLEAWTASQALYPSFISDTAWMLAEQGLMPANKLKSIVLRLRETGTGLSAGINSDLKWGMEIVAQHVRGLKRTVHCPQFISEEHKERETAGVSI